MSQDCAISIDFGRNWKPEPTSSDSCLISLARMKTVENSFFLVWVQRLLTFFTSGLTLLPLTGDIRLNGEEYSVNDGFKDCAVQLADELDLDEIEAARLLLDVGDDLQDLDGSSTSSAIIHFHERRQFLLESLRLVLKQSTDPESEGDAHENLLQLVVVILEVKDGPARNGSLYAQKCLAGMADIESWLRALGDRVQGALTLGRPSNPELEEILQFQQASLGQQHESLSAIVTYLVKANYTGVEDFYKVLGHLPRLDRWNSISLHYVPIITALASQYGSPDGSSTFREAKMIHQRIMDDNDSKQWPLRNLQAATISWWLAEYSGWFLEQIPGSPMQGMDHEAEAQKRSKIFFQALLDGSLHCILSIASQIRPRDWYDPARSGLTKFLLQDAPALPLEVMYTSKYFQDLVMENLESFVDAFVANMPDTLRRFKAEEDDQRRKVLSNLQADARNIASEQDFHLERFLLIVSYVFDNRIDAAQSFWADVDSNLYGFLQWASKRQSTPRAAAFCEMLRAISKGETCATAAHHFLQEESTTTSARIRKSSSLSWAQIFEELNLYTSSAPEHPLRVRFSTQPISEENSDGINEPESPLMLESYLRLTSHLCRESREVRMWLFEHPTFRIIDALFLLSNNVAPSRIQACAFSVLQALLVEKTPEIGMAMWTMLDQWISAGLSPAPGAVRSTRVSTSLLQSEEATFNLIAQDFEASCEFVNFIHALVSPAATDTGLNDALPFPEQLGSTYRMPGIEPYIDFVFARLFATMTSQLEDPLQVRVLRCSILSFAATCLATFNEDLVILANKSTIAVESAITASSLAAYVRLHPFGRVMEWMFNEKTLIALFATAHQDINEVSNASSDSPLVISLLHSIKVMNLTMELQSTYLEIVRPQIKMQPLGHRKPVLNPALATFEDSVATHLELINDLGFYAGTGHQTLVISSLRLLERFSVSRKLNHQVAQGIGKKHSGNRLVEVLEQEGDSERIARSLISAMQIDLRELDDGDEAPGWIVKSAILDFLIHCLAASSDKPTIAHALLGFSCKGHGVQPDGLFAGGASLFHAVVDLVVDYPNGEGENMLSWSLSLKQKAMGVLSHLWMSPLTAVVALAELRASDFLYALFLRQETIGPHTQWDGRNFQDPDFVYTNSIIAYSSYLAQRCALFEYTSADIRLGAVEAASSTKARILSTLLGSTSMPNGTKELNPSILDLFDFAVLDVPESIQFPTSSIFASVDFTVGRADDDAVPGDLYNLKLMEELITLRLGELRVGGRLQDSNEENRAMNEAQTLLLFFHGENQRLALQYTRLRAFRAWTDVLRLAIVHCELEDSSKATLILRSLQIINPKLEGYAEENSPEALDLARLILALLVQLDFGSSTLDRARGGDIANDKLFQTFRSAVRAIHVPEGDSRLRELLYNICSTYLAGTATSSDSDLRRRHSTNTIKAAGQKLIDITCDDAYGGNGKCRISALLFLDSLVALAMADKSVYLLESLIRTNFIVVLVETIRDIPRELRETNSKGNLVAFSLVSYTDQIR